jgi:hypothetical protein
MEGATLYGMIVDCFVTGGILLGIMGRYHEREFVRWCVRLDELEIEAL